MKAAESSHRFSFYLLLMIIIVPIIMTYFVKISQTKLVITDRKPPPPVATVSVGLETPKVVEAADINSSLGISSSSLTNCSSTPVNISDNVDYTFLDTLLSIPWDDVKKYDVIKQRKTSEDVLRKILPSIIAEPIAEINQSCRPSIDYSSFSPSQIQDVCSKSSRNIFTGEVNQQLIRIGIVIMLGFETDVIEIRLRETYDFVDRIFIGESTNAHNKLIRKPLIWEYLAAQKRFEPFLDKIVRFVVDESNGLSETWKQYEGSIWKSETVQRESLNQKLINWNKETKFFKDHHLVLVDHADDVIAARNLFKLRNCKIRSDVGVITNKQWFPWSRLDTAYGLEALSAGGFNTWSHFVNATSAKMRRTDGAHFIRGGMHMTDAPYAPFMFAKRYLSCTECSSVFASSGKQNLISQKIREYAQTGDKRKFMTSMQQALIAQPQRHIQSGRLVKLSAVKDLKFHQEVYHIPWFLKCNLERYPGWMGRIDPRIGMK